MKKTISKICTIITCLIIFSCDDFVKIDPPRTSLIKSTVFESSSTANAAVIDLYYQLKSGAFASGSTTSISFFLSTSADEQNNFYLRSTPVINGEFQQFYDNKLVPNNSLLLSLWSDIYKTIYKANAIIEGLDKSATIAEAQRNQYRSEAKFVRAFCFFYLVNLWGDVPLAISTDYETNQNIGRSSESDVYSLIKADLVDAVAQLPSGYSFANNERVRVSKEVAMALLSRVSLFTKDWSSAENYSTSVIGNSSLFSLGTNLSNVFVKNNSEIVFQLWSDTRPTDRSTFRVFTNPPLFAALRPELVSAFETGDQRYTKWVTPFAPYYGASKYTSVSDNPATEYTTLIRLPELYLIRAEARLMQGNLTGAKADINTIRNRSGLSNTSAVDVTGLMNAILQERRVEFFTEWGHRWLDLKRTDRLSSLVGALKPQWTSSSVLFPIPESEINNNAALKGKQNPGY